MGMDAVALYPSIEKEIVTKLCREAAERTEVRIRNMNQLEATRFLMLTMNSKEIQDCGLTGVLPRRRMVPGKRTGKLGLTTENSFKPTPNDQTQWVWPSVRLDRQGGSRC